METYSDEKRPAEVAAAAAVAGYEGPINRPSVLRKKPFWRRDGVRMWIIFGGLISYVLVLSFAHKSLPSAAPPITTASGKPKTSSFIFDKIPTCFHVHQESQATLPTRTEVFGKVVVLAADDRSRVDAESRRRLKVDFDIVASDDGIWEKVVVRKEKGGIVFSADVPSLTKQTVNITATLHIPQSVHFSMFSIITRELNITLDAAFKAQIDNVKLKSLSGDIMTGYGKDTYMLEAKKVEVSTTGGSVCGGFGVDEVLDVKSVSGDITLNLTSANALEKPSYLHTQTTTGKTHATYISPLHPRPLFSSHKSTSGDISLIYPNDWQGKIKAASTTGDIDIHGEGVMVVRRRNRVSGAKVEAVKGDGKSRVKMGSVGGSIRFGIVEGTDK